MRFLNSCWRVEAAPTAFAANAWSALVSDFQQRKRRKRVERGEESLKSCVFFLASESLLNVVNHSKKQVPLMH